MLVWQCVADLKAREGSLPKKLNDDAYVALAAYTFDNDNDRAANIYFAVNKALRERQVNPAGFEIWQGYIYYLLQALNQLPQFQGETHPCALCF